MKSPWNFLTRLTSRRKQDDALQNSVEQGNDHKAIEGESQKKPALLLESPEVDRDVSAAPDLGAAMSSTEADEAQAILPLVDVEDVPVPASESGKGSGDDLPAPVSEDTVTAKPPKAARTKRPQRVKTDFTQPLETKALARNEDQIAQRAPSANPVLDEMAKLDEDIKVLRSQLTQKLALQNDHLKKMLERFDRG